MLCGPIAWSISWPWAACRVDRKHAKETLLRGNRAYCSEGAQKADAAPEGTASLLLLHMAAELRQVSTQESGKSSVMKAELFAVQNCIGARADI